VDAQHAAARTFAWGGAGLFAAALAYFLFSYAVTFGEITPGGTPANTAPRAIAIDVALFSAFALHHSIFARDSVRAFVRRLFPAEIERSVYVWVASLMLIGVCYSWRPVPGVIWQIPTPWSWATVAVQVAGIWLTFRGATVIDGLELAGVRPQRGQILILADPQGSRSDPNQFKTEGPYGWVRHPIYLGWILVVFGMGTMTMTRLVFAAVSSVYLVVGIHFEERTLRAHSAGAYDDYMRRVPWKLVPRVY
jgi:protein-S-isoprenylcysteine O-methyltransferase Ste14